MAGDLVTLAAEAVPYASAALGAYGGAVLAKVRDDLADKTVGVGVRLLQRIFGHKRDGEALPEVLAEVVANPDDEDYLNQLKFEIRKALEADAALAKDVAAILAEARPNVTVTQNVVAGRDVYNSGRDMTVNRGRD